MIPSETAFTQKKGWDRQYRQLQSLEDGARDHRPLCLLPSGNYLGKEKPMISMLMIPKICMYIWIISMGLGLLGKI